MSKKYFATLIVAVVAIFAGYNMYQSQSTVNMSDLALVNVEALATPEQPYVFECDFHPSYSCEALHPTDPSRDVIRHMAKW